MQKIEMRVYCAKCGDVLTVSQPQIILNDFTLLVSPCKKCASQQSVHPTFGGHTVSHCTFCGGVLPKHQLPCPAAKSG